MSVTALVVTARAAQPAAHPENALVDGPPLVQTWTPPVYPPEALAEKAGGKVTVRIVVDENGHVTSARSLQTSDPRLGEAAVAAVKQWTFSPAIENWKLIPMCLDVPLSFDAAKGARSWPPGMLPPPSVVVNIRPAPRTAAVLKSAPLGDYPASLADRRLTGTVTYICRVDDAGHASGLRVVSASHADFVPAVLAAFSRWEFSPGMQGDLPVAGEMQGEATFDAVAAKPAEVLAANGITAPDGTAPADCPLPVFVVDPVWPFEALFDGEGGGASVDFTVQPGGTVTDVRVRDATRPEFGRALVAALEGWSFRPAVSNGQPVAVALVKHAEFKAVPVDAAPGESSDPLVRLVRLARVGEIRGGAGLDEKPAPLYRVAPGYPAALRTSGRPSGQAIVDFVIDRDGRARLPRVVSSTHEEFGWAAATAVTQWVFKVPRRGGGPTEVKVQIPFQFTAPAE